MLIKDEFCNKYNLFEIFGLKIEKYVKLFIVTNVKSRQLIKQSKFYLILFLIIPTGLLNLVINLYYQF